MRVTPRVSAGLLTEVLVVGVPAIYCYGFRAACYVLVKIDLSGQNRVVLVSSPRFLAEGAVERIEAFTVTAFKSDTDRESLSAGILSKVYVAWLLENHFHYHEAVAAAARYRGDVTSPQVSDPGATALFAYCCVNMNGEADWIFQN